MKITQVVSRADVGIRLDKFVQKIASGEKMTFTRAWVIQLIKHGHVRVNHKISKPSHRIAHGESIELRLKSPEELRLKPNRKLNVPVLFENERLLAVDKPAGMPIAPTSHNSKNTLANFLVARDKHLARIGTDPLRAGTVHRLDKDTSGVVLVAKDNKTHLELSQLFRERRIIKSYVALVWGTVTKKAGEVDLPLAITYNANRRRRIARPSNEPAARDAKTRYKVIERFPNFTLLELAPRTGRFHQIRAHMAAIGRPVVGDKLYGTNHESLLRSSGTSEGQARITNHGISRQFLHAARIEFTLFGKHYEIASPLPDDLKKILEQLRKIAGRLAQPGLERLLDTQKV